MGVIDLGEFINKAHYLFDAEVGLLPFDVVNDNEPISHNRGDDQQRDFILGRDDILVGV